MKLITKEGKLFGIINIVDLMVLILVIALTAGIGYKLFAPKVREVASPTVTMTTICRIRGATSFMQDELNRNDQTGKKLVSGNDYVDATIESITMEDYIVQSITDEGIIVDSLDPTKKDVIVTIKSKVAKDTPTPKIGNQEVRAGRTLILKTNDFETVANIDAVIFE